LVVLRGVVRVDGVRAERAPHLIPKAHEVRLLPPRAPLERPLPDEQVAEARPADLLPRTSSGVEAAKELIGR
jgi:hypothetical protein